MAKAFAAAGASVACVARRETQLRAVVDEINASGGHAIAIVGDVTARGAPQAILAQAEKQLGPVDILINNAGRSRVGPVVAEPEDLDAWFGTYELNVRAPVAMARAVLPSMLARKSGTIITVGSGVATMALPVMTAYASSKAAIAKFHELLQIELDGTAVFTYSLCPGLVKSELGTADYAINQSREATESPLVKKFIEMLSQRPESMYGDPELAADTLVAMSADDRYKAMAGRQLSCGEDQEPLLAEIEKPNGGRIAAGRLYQVNIGQLAV